MLTCGWTVIRRVALPIWAVALALSRETSAADATTRGTAPTAQFVKDATPVHEGVLSYTVTSDYQKKPTRLEVLLPDKLEPGRRYPTLYLLPVNVGTDGGWGGSGMVQLRKHNLHNLYQVICVCPAYDTEPWFGDNPAAGTRQTPYLVDIVVPFVDREFPTIAKREGRVLVGFSKSGLGALGALLRHRDVFDRAAAFDPYIGTPTEEQWQLWGFAQTYGTRANYDAYDPMLLIQKHKVEFSGKQSRIVLMAGGPGSRLGVDMFLTRMRDSGVNYTYMLLPNVTHRYDTGWLPLAVAGVLAN